nr:hypothetical protein [Tanacetum cinerariifolium]
GEEGTSQYVSPVSMSKSSCDSSNVEIKNSGVIWKKKGSSNTSNVGLSAVSVSNLNKNVKRYSRKDLLAWKHKDGVGMEIPSWMITDEMKLMENHQMYVLVFGADVRRTQSQPIECTKGTHRTTSNPRSPNPDVEEGESTKQNVQKVEEHLIAEEIEKLVERTENVENLEVDSSTLSNCPPMLENTGNNSGQQRDIKCLNFQWEGHMARQCLKPKRRRNATWFRDKVLLVEAQGSGKVLNKVELEFLADPKIAEAKAVLMANLSSYRSDVLSEIKLTLYDGGIIANETNAISIVDSEETLMLEEESQSKMLLKQSDPMVLEKKVKIKPINYVELNRLSKDFSKRFVPQQELSDEQAFQLQISHPNTNQSASLPIKNEALWELPKEKSCCPNSIKNDLRKLKGKDIVDNAAQVLNATTIASGMYKLDLGTLAPKDKNNRESHIYYLKHTIEQAVILREIVKQAKLLNPLNSASYYACKYVKLIQELLGYVRDTCLDIYKPSEKLVVVTPINKKKTVRSKSTDNTKNDKILQISSSTQKKNKTLIVLFEFVSAMNASSKSKSGKKAKEKEEWKPTRKVFTKIRYNWRPIGRTFTLVGNACPLTRITATNKVPLTEPIPLEEVAQESVVTKVYTRRPKVPQTNGFNSKPKIAKFVISNKTEQYLDSGCSKHMTGDRSQLINFVHKFLGTVKFGNDQIANIIGYYKSVGISHETSVARSPQQNGVVERRNCTLVEAAQTIEDLGKLQAKANIGIFMGYAPKNKAYRPGLQSMTPATFSLGLVSNHIPQKPCYPPRDDYDRLFQPMFDEYFNPPTISISPVPVATAPRDVDLADSPMSASINQDAPLTNSTSQGASSNVRPIHTPFKSLGRCTKDNLIENVIEDPSHSVSTKKQIQTDAMWCYFDAFLTSFEPKNFKQVMTKLSWIDEMQEEIHEFEMLQATVNKHKASYRFKIDNKRFSVNVKVFRDILNICLRVSGQEFDAPQTEEEALSFICELGHSGEIKYITDLTRLIMQLPPPKLKKPKMKSDLAISSKETPSKKKPTKAKKDVPSKKKPTSKPKPMKKKAPVKADRGKCLNVLSEVALPKAAQLKEATKRRKKDFHISQANGSGNRTGFESRVTNEQQRKLSGTDEITGAKPGVPDVPKYDYKSDKESWGDSEKKMILKTMRVVMIVIEMMMMMTMMKKKKKKMLMNSLIKKMIRRMKKSQMMEEKDVHMTLTTVHDTQKTKGLMQSSFVSYDFTEKLLNFENAPPTDNEIASLMDTTVRTEEPNGQTSTLFTVPVTTSHRYLDSMIKSSTWKEICHKLSKLTKYREEAQAKKQEYIDNVNSTMRTIIREEVKTQLPKILPKVVSDFATLVTKQNVTESLEVVVLAWYSSQPKSTYEAAASLSEYELTKILLDKMEESKSHLRADYKRELYDALVKSYNTNKDIFITYVEVFTLNRSRDDKDKDQDPFAGSDRGTKRRKSSKEDESQKDPRSKEGKSSSSFKDTSCSHHKSSSKSAHAEEISHTVDDSGVQKNQEFDTGNNDEQPEDEASPKNDWFKKPERPPTPDPDWNKRQHVDFRAPKTWISVTAHVEKPPTSFDELTNTPIDFSAFVMNQINITNLTQELLVGPTFNLLKGTCKSLTELEYRFEECSKATTERFD